MTDRELMQMALDALNNFDKGNHGMRWQVPVIKALRARLAQPEPEPVAWWHDRGDVVDLNVSGHGTPLYFAPPKKKWVGLTDEEINSLINTWVRELVFELEVMLRNKNT